MFMKRGKSRTAIRAITSTCFLIFGFALAHGGSTGEILKATPEQLDFGAIPEGEPAVATAFVENVGDSPVEITNVRTT
jgi:hypothetical protein